MVGVKLNEKRLYKHGGGIRAEQLQVTVGRNPGQETEDGLEREGDFQQHPGNQKPVGVGPQAPGDFQICQAQGLCISPVRTFGGRSCCGHPAAWVPHLSFESSSHHLFVDL